MRVAPSVPHTHTPCKNNDALLFFSAQKADVLPREKRFASHSCILGVARIHAVPSPGTGGLSALRLMALRPSASLRLLYITSALFFSLLLSDPVQVPQQWPDAQNTHGTQEVYKHRSVHAQIHIRVHAHTLLIQGLSGMCDWHSLA